MLAGLFPNINSGNLRTAVTHRVYTGPSQSHITSARKIDIESKPKVRTVKKIAIQKRQRSADPEETKYEEVEKSETNQPKPKKKKQLQNKKAEKL